MEKKPRKAREDELVREFPTLGRYRVRLMKDLRRPGNPEYLDIREYVNEEKFQGFTRRGIRLSDRAQLDLLRDVVVELMEQHGFARPAGGLLPTT
jgi:hypothetical protein